MDKEMEQVNVWAKSRQLSSPFHGAVVVSQEAHVFSIGYVLRYGLGITAVAADKNISGKVLKNLRKELRSFGKIAYRKKEGYIHFLFRQNKDVPLVVIDNALAAFSTALDNGGIKTRESCVYCGVKETNYGLEIEPGVVVPAHYHCRVEGRQRDFYLTQKHQQPNNYLKGSIGAVFGGVLGALPHFFVQALTTYNVNLLYVLIPMAAAVGFQKARGKSGNFQKVVISVVALLVMMFSFLHTSYFAPYVYQYQLFRQAQMVISNQATVSQVVTKYPEIGEAVGAYETIFPEGKKGLSPSYFVKQLPIKELYGESYFGYLTSSFSKEYLQEYKRSMLSVVFFTVAGILFTLRQISNLRREERLALLAIGRLEKPVSFLIRGTQIGEVDDTQIPPKEPPRKKISGEYLFAEDIELENMLPERPKTYEEIFGELFDSDETHETK